MTKQLLGTEGFIEDYLHVIRISENESMAESKLTAILSEFCILFHRYKSSVAAGHGALTTPSLLDKVVDYLTNSRTVSPGALECHAFDMAIIRGVVEIKDSHLEASYQLMQSAVTWRDLSQDARGNLVTQFLVGFPNIR